MATGESVGQVASQTLKSIVAIEDAIHMPIIRPLATTDNEFAELDDNLKPIRHYYLKK